MIIKIEKPNKQIAKTLEYNENKATGEEGIHLQNQMNEDIASKEKGHIVVTRNVPEQSSLENEFARLQMLNFKTIRGRKLSNVAFHMSVNPSEDDRKLSEKEMVGYIDELMERLGYKDCPYRIYKHTDIEREHYHVVAIRIGQDGKKIKDNFENLRANKIGIELEKKYGYKIGKKAKEERETKEAESRSRTDAKNEESKNDETAASTDSQKDKPAYIPRFNMKSAIPKINQVKDIHNEAMKWSFTTMEQYQALLKWRFSLMAEQYDNGMLYCGLEDKGKKSNTKSLNEKELGLECLEQIMERIQETDMKEKKRQRERVEQVAKWCAQEAHSWKEFRELTERKGVYTVISWTKDGEAFGVTWIDRATKCIWKGSETGTDLKWLKSKAAKKGWDIERYHRYDKEPKAKPATILRKEANATMKEKSEIRDKKEQNAMQQLAQRMRNMSVAETTKGSTSSGNDEDEEATDNEIINTWHMHL